LLNSPEQQSKTRDTINKLKKDDPLVTNGPEVMSRVRKHKSINTLEHQALCSYSAAAASKVERMSLCRSVCKSVKNGLDHTPVGDWTKQRLQDHADGMYRATELVHQLNTMRQHIPSTPSGTLFELEKMPLHQKLIIDQMLAASPAIYGHVMMQMTTNPSLPVHAPDLPPRAKLLDANNQLLVTQGHYPSFNECVPGHTKIGGDCNEGFTSVLRKHNMKLDPDCQVFLDAGPAGHVYANMHTEGDMTRTVRQVPHDRHMRNTFDGEGDVADLLQLFAQMEMGDIMCLRLVAARFQKTGLDDRSITWGATGERAWGQNVLTGAAAERRDEVLAEELATIHPQAFLQPERAIDLNPDNKAATASAIVKLHNDMQRAAKKGGFSLLNYNVPPMLFQDAAFHKLKEMSTIGPWIDRQGMLQWDYVSGAGFKGAHRVRNGNLGGAVRKDAMVENDGHMVNDKGVLCSRVYHELGILSSNARGQVHEANALGEHHSHICISAICQRGDDDDCFYYFQK